MARDSDTDGTEPDTACAASNTSKDRISKALKQVYDDVAEEPLPEKLAALLEQLKAGKNS